MRKLEVDDIRKIHDLFERNPEYKGTVLPLIDKLLGGVVEERDGKIVAAGFLKPFIEAFVVLPGDYSEFSRAKLTKALFEECMKFSKENHVDFIYARPLNEAFSNLLTDHFGFAIMDGHYMVKRT